MPTFEIIAIGNELLSGHTINTNAAYLGQELSKLGLSCQRHQVLPDDPVLLKAGLEEALARSPLIVTTGGLGPTLDDRTRQVLAEVFDAPLEMQSAVLEELEARYGKAPIGLENQATLPRGAKALLNSIGTAPGILLGRGESILIALPGVPQELQVLLQEQVLPFLQAHFPSLQRPHLRKFSLCQHSESSLDPHLRGLQEAFPDMEIGIYPHTGYITVHLCTSESEARVEEAAERLRKLLGAKLVSDRGLSLAEAVQDRFIREGWTLSTAESCTGGRVAGALTAIPGSSQYFLGSVVSYANSVKRDVLGVPEEVLQRYGAVSEPTVRAMAEGARRLTGSTYGLATSGVAGPGGGSSEKPVGLVHFALSGPRGTEAWSCKMKGNREKILLRSVHEVLAGLWMSLSDIDKAS